MIKTLFLIGALLVPGLAYAANPSAPFSVQVVDPPNGIACDVGPNYTGTIPAPARAAGFTHCVANYDFTQTQQFTTNGHTYQWSNLSSWLDCAGASNPLLWGKNYGVAMNCSDVSVSTDGSLQVLRMQYLPSDTNGQTWLNTASQQGYPNSAGIHIKHGYYAEEESRADSTWQ